MQPTVWNRWGPLALLKRISGRPVPGKDFSPEGYDISNLGPKAFHFKDSQDQEVFHNKLKSQTRSGCPFGHS
jgi:hypothetical protein